MEAGIVPVLCGSCVGIHTCSKFMCVIEISCPGEIFLQHTFLSYGSSILFLPCPLIFPEPGESALDEEFKTKHSTVPDSWFIHSFSYRSLC